MELLVFGLKASFRPAVSHVISLLYSLDLAGR